MLSFLLACLVVELTPGPNMAYLAALSSVMGRKAGFSLVAGISTGLLIIGLAAALGEATLVAESPVIYHVLRLLGTLYMVWLAWDNWHDEKAVAGPATEAFSRYFRRGFITNVLNPKAAIFYVSVLPEFINPARPALPQLLAMTLIYVCIATAVHGMIAIFGDAARPLLDNPAKIRTARRFFSLLLLCIAVWFALSTRGGG
jgi:threonine/homoserine/homoserine lactone efflux protein